MRSPMDGVFGRVINERVLCESNCFRDGLFWDAVVPFLHDVVPIHAFAYHLKHLPHHDARADERRLAVADSRIGDDVAAQEFLRFFGHLFGPRASYGWSLHSRIKLDLFEALFQFSIAE